MTFLWYTWFPLITIFLIWQHFSKMWPLKDTVSSAWTWVSWPCTSVSPDYKIFWDWYHCIHLFYWCFLLFFFSVCFLFFVLWRNQSKRWPERNTNFLYLTVLLLLIWNRCSLQLSVFTGLYMQSPAMVRLHTFPSNDAALLETQDLWREAMGPQKPQVVTPQPWQSCKLCGIQSLLAASCRGVEGEASQLPEQGFRWQWITSLSCLALQNSEKWIRTSAVAVMWRWKWLFRLGCITLDKYFSSQLLTLSVCVRKGNSLLVDLVDI